jgi:adenylate kinase
MKSLKQFLEAIEIDMPMTRIIMIGGPGSGKSTYSEFLNKHFKIPHIYMGDMMRELQKTNPEVAKIMDAGNLVPLRYVIKALKDRLEKPDTKKGYILDGFPRNIEQLNKMKEENVNYDYVVFLDVSEKEVIKRLSARGRKDDKPEIIKNRIGVYEKETGPVLRQLEKDSSNDVNKTFLKIKAEGPEPKDIANKIIKDIENEKL